MTVAELGHVAFVHTVLSCLGHPSGKYHHISLTQLSERFCRCFVQWREFPCLLMWTVNDCLLAHVPLLDHELFVSMDSGLLSSGFPAPDRVQGSIKAFAKQNQPFSIASVRI